MTGRTVGGEVSLNFTNWRAPMTDDPMTDDPNKKQNDPTQIGEKAASNRDNNLVNNSGIQTTAPGNLLLKGERTRSRIGKTGRGWTASSYLNPL